MAEVKLLFSNTVLNEKSEYETIKQPLHSTPRKGKPRKTDGCQSRLCNRYSARDRDNMTCSSHDIARHAVLSANETGSRRRGNLDRVSQRALRCGKRKTSRKNPKEHHLECECKGKQERSGASNQAKLKESSAPHMSARALVKKHEPFPCDVLTCFICSPASQRSLHHNPRPPATNLTVLAVVLRKRQSEKRMMPPFESQPNEQSARKWLGCATLYAGVGWAPPPIPTQNRRKPT